MSRKVIVRAMLASKRMRKDVICIPGSLDQAATDVTASCRLQKDVVSFRPRQRLPGDDVAKG
jgi:hypothetical protein